MTQLLDKQDIINGDKIKCLACNRVLSRLTPSHFKNKKLCNSKINTIIEYKILYPMAELTARNIIAKQVSTKENMISRYGEEIGLLKWDSYCKKQAETNTFEYKQKKYNITKEEFNRYNQSRAITKENMISRYGEEVGLLKWNTYCERQSYAGCAEDYFIKKYGEKEGKTFYINLNKQKAITLPNFIRKYGEDEGLLQYNNLTMSNHYYSKPSQELFSAIDNELLKIFNSDTSYYAIKNKEFHKWSHVLNKSCCYDYVISSMKFCIEYNGDIYHANPCKYLPTEIPRYRGNKKTALEIWKHDRLKNEVLINEGWQVLIIWDSDYQADKSGTIKKVIEYAKTMQHNK